MIITAEFPAGTTIKDAARKALAFAKRNDCSVYFKFNEFEFLARPSQIEVDIVADYYERLLQNEVKSRRQSS
ncbi:MAG: hypothetical protein IJQ34_00695 [Kiritimatiellae bacterium]|nr:hypothetical protein [Kiritimatiellia bacterium]